MVRQDQITTIVPRAAGGQAARLLSQSGLRGSRLLDADFKARLREQARRLGFDACRVTHSGAIPEAPGRLKAWLASGAAGTMDWLHAAPECRSDPRKLWPETASIILLGMNYGPAENPLPALARRSQAYISVYARNRDYHGLIKGRLKLLGSWLAAQAPGSALKVFVDTAPVMEKPLAAAAGMGWAGKHTNLVSREFGSWLFLGAIFTNVAIPPDAAETGHCGRCRACLDICPAKAFPQPYVLDARRCISYLTIEHKGHIAQEFRALIGNRVFGCDDCLAVCPWNKFASAAREVKLQAREDLTAPALASFLRFDDTAFRAFFSGSPVKRIGYDRFTRNVLIAAGNSRDAGLAGTVREKLFSSSPLVRAMAVWALGRLLPFGEVAKLAARLSKTEPDATVKTEWVSALASAKMAAQRPSPGGNSPS
ncbi:MAG TPA: tRNA epoxyqueuosine(34) reductase QueG [Methylocella sp.]|nr:tRNA epoxyqueuosine(34) reductase QueG [Methylocella sp.]